MKKLSICIPTFNRSYHLNNCLNSIMQNGKYTKYVEICISDNDSTDETEKIVNSYKKFLNINYKKNVSNLGVAKNILKSVELSNSDFCWIVGDDDLLLDNALKVVLDLIKNYNNTDFFYVNSFHLNSSELKNYSYPTKTGDITSSLKKYSTYDQDIHCKFRDLINTKYCFDFFGGLYLSVFRKKNWDLNLRKIDYKKLEEKVLFSNLDNTFPHAKIFSYAFKDSFSFFYTKPLSINLSGEREWKNLYPIVRTFRTAELLDTYYLNGIGFSNYLKNKNKILGYFVPDVIKIIFNFKETYRYIPSIVIFYIRNFYYPNIYLSIFYQVTRTLKKLIK